jgi:hypothetical protein
MLKYQARKLVAIHVAVDVAATALAWLGAYALRFHADPVGWVLPVTKGVPELSRYLLLLPLMAVLWPAVLYFHGLYRSSAAGAASTSSSRSSSASSSRPP